MCGEKCGRAARFDACQGSPPRVRGKDAARLMMFSIFGITPACAGKSTTPRSQAPALGDHPRVCGEKRLLHFFGFCVIGSPPRVRGKAVVILLCVATFRITPACAGKSRTSYRPAQQGQDHPRVCGEKHFRCIVGVSIVGSSPRVRGKDKGGKEMQTIYGITPACAGKR